MKKSLTTTCGYVCIAFLMHTYPVQKDLEMKNHKEEFAIPPTEDLMREHGILNRLLLIYEEVIKRLDRNEFPLKPFQKAVTILESFIEQYHEKMEEDYIFPIFEKAGKEVVLVKTLRIQHIEGRKVTAKIKQLIVTHDKTKNEELHSLLSSFITMYRPHEAREDTELFPLVRELISEKEFKEIGEIFEKTEHDIFGKEGFDGILHRVEAIEKELGIFNLNQFTPKS